MSTDWADLCAGLAVPEGAPAADRAAFDAFQSLVGVLGDALADIEANGAVLSSDSGVFENPAVSAAAKFSRELRGWVERRPDLFAQQVRAGVSGRRNFKARLEAV